MLISLEEAQRNLFCIFHLIQFRDAIGANVFLYALTIDQIVIKLGITKCSHTRSFVNFPAVVSRRRNNLEAPSLQLLYTLHRVHCTLLMCRRSKNYFEREAALE